MTGCRHCGLEVGQDQGPAAGDPEFCCPGCEAAYAMIRDAGLGSYYKRRVLDPNASPMRPDDEPFFLDPAPYSSANPDGSVTLHLMVEGLQCAACVWLIETVLARTEGVVAARLNMTTRRLALTWNPEAGDIAQILGVVSRLGYRLLPYDPSLMEQESLRRNKELLRSMAVAGFAAANVMLLSVAVWVGAGEGSGGGQGPATQGLMHWFSALIALPAIAYAGLPFYRSALGALRAGRANMDLPISLAILLTAGMSLFETMRGGEQVYFESATMLLFFLLIGRYLDRRARGQAHEQAERLSTLGAKSVTVLNADGTRRSADPRSLEPGAVVLTAMGERVSVDGVVVEGVSELDCSLLTGESVPVAVKPEDKVFAGTLNIGGPLRLCVTATGENTVLAEIARLMETAEKGRGRYVRMADRVARLYAPVVHGLALLSFLGWVFIAGASWQEALLIATSVLVITCPCALALAIPVVQVVAVSRLMGRGILVKSGTALERLSQIDHVVFDKTGTLTEGNPVLANEREIEPEALDLAAAMAAASTHPLARALARPRAKPLSEVKEIPGSGLEWEGPDGIVRLGRRDWCGVSPDEEAASTAPELWLARPAKAPVRFCFSDRTRRDAKAVVTALTEGGIDVALLSGDRPRAVAAAANEAGIEQWRAEVSPEGKVHFLQRAEKEGRLALMVGDGLNDAPALAAAHVSASPGRAADITRNAADIVFQGDRLAPLLEVLAVSRRAGRLVKQNLAFAFAYNALTIPLAVFGYVSPLVAAASMSASSIVVIANALRLGRKPVLESMI